MKKLLILLFLLFVLISTAWAIPPAPIPPIRCTDCSIFIADGILCYDTSTDKFYIGNGTAAVEIVNLSTTIFPATGIPVYDTNSSHILYLKAGSDITANKNLTFTTGDSDRTITLSGNPTLADWFDQAVKAASAVTFATVDTGQGANELYDMDQNVLTSSSPIFSGLFLKTVTKAFADTGYTALSTDFSIIWNAVGGGCVQNLPAATGTGRILEIKKVDASANLITITTNGAELLDGFTTQTLTAQWEAITIQDTAAGVWHIL